MIGQKKILEKVNNITLDTFPRSLLLVGSNGCGKHTLCSMIADKLNLEMQDISDSLNLETIEEIQSKVEPYLYIIDGKSITIKEESVILKFLEEPLKNSFIIILCENKGFMLNTILNRCIIWEFENYTIDELKQIAPMTEIGYRLANTPGKVLKWAKEPIEDVIALCTKIVDKIGCANFSNALTLTAKIDFDNDGKGFEKELFKQALVYSATNKYIVDKTPLAFNIYSIVKTYVNRSNIPHIDEKKLFEHCLYDLRIACRSGVQ